MKKRLPIVFIAIMGFFSICSIDVICHAANQTSALTIEGKHYEIPANKKYTYTDYEPIGEGNVSAGKLEIRGDSIEKEKFGGKVAYGVTGNAAFVFKYNNTLRTEDSKKWHIVKDKTKNVNGRKLDSNILKGVLLIQKSSNGKDYTDAANPVCDFFNTPDSEKEFYKTGGSDKDKGVFYRITIAYKVEKKEGWFPEDTRVVDLYEFYVVENSGIITIHNLSSDEELVKKESEGNTMYTQELLLHGETLVNNSVTRDGFKIEKYPTSYDVTVKRNSGEAQAAKTDYEYTADGKYTITVTTKLGVQYETIIFVFKGGEDKGYSTYFADGFIQAERIHKGGPYPTYARGGRILVRTVNGAVPVIHGSLKNADSGEIVYTLKERRRSQSYTLTPGNYVAELYNGNPDVAGSIYRYSFRFTVVDEESKPYVNYDNLMNSYEMKDFKTKHYEVAYQTTAGGFIYVCFSMDSYDDALRYAREIEARFVEYPDGKSEGDEFNGAYYKDEENPNKKVKYYDKTKLTSVAEKYAKQNVEINYFNSLDEFTYRTYNNDLLECLEELSEKNSIKVFPSEEEKEKLISRKPYLNGFKFVHVSDYDVVTVDAISKNTGNTTRLKFQKPVEEQLKETSLYTIVETNEYGNTSEYEAYYVNECNTSMVWHVINDGLETTKEVSYNDVSDEKIVLDADSAFVSDIKNVFDEEAIVTIKAPDVYSFEMKCLASEFTNLEFNKVGKYEISFIDRTGHSYEVELNISGHAGYEKKKDANLSYTQFYNKLYKNEKDEREDYTELADLIPEENGISEKEDVVDETELGEVDSSGIKPTEDEISDVVEEKTNNWVWLIVIVILLVMASVAGVIIVARKRKMKNLYDFSIKVNEVNPSNQNNNNGLGKEDNEDEDKE